MEESTWGYRLVRWTLPRGEVCALHEVYYDETGAIEGYTDPVYPCGETPQEVLRELEMMLEDASTHPVLEASALPPDNFERLQKVVEGIERGEIGVSPFDLMDPLNQPTVP